jgi:thiol:disulfide interchange protein
MRVSIVILLVSILSCASEVAWIKGLDVALKQAAEEKKFVVLDLSASWCGYCRRMAREVYPDPQFVEFSRSQLFVRLFADTDPQGPDLVTRFKVRGFPTILVLNARGEEVGRLEGARDRDKLIQEIKTITSRSTSTRQ